MWLKELATNMVLRMSAEPIEFGRQEKSKQRARDFWKQCFSCFCLLFQRGSLISGPVGLVGLSQPCDNFRSSFYIVLRTMYVVTFTEYMRKGYLLVKA